jgi:spore protease
VNTIQLCNTGIRPGSGVGNARPALLPEEIGIPILSIGVPTVVDAATLAADAIDLFTK